MHFFRAREVADDWASERPGVVALTLDEAWELARVHWVARVRRACLHGRPTGEEAASSLTVGVED